MNESEDEKFGETFRRTASNTCPASAQPMRRPPRDHLPPVPVVTEKLDNALHAHLVPSDVFPVIVSACGQAQWRFQLASAVALFVFA